MCAAGKQGGLPQQQRQWRQRRQPLTLYRPAAVLPALHFLRDGIAVRLVIKQIVGGRLASRQLCCAHEPDLLQGRAAHRAVPNCPAPHRVETQGGDILPHKWRCKSAGSASPIIMTFPNIKRTSMRPNGWREAFWFCMGSNMQGTGGDQAEHGPSPPQLTAALFGLQAPMWKQPG